MPTLTPEEQARTLGPLDYTCGRCGKIPVRNYCRQCDEFFHICDCPVEKGSLKDHDGHRTY